MKVIKCCMVIGERPAAAVVSSFGAIHASCVKALPDVELLLIIAVMLQCCKTCAVLTLLRHDSRIRLHSSSVNRRAAQLFALG